MKCFIDFEFIEHFKKPIKWLPTFGSFNKPFHTIELISIGLASSDGREYYAISKEFNSKDADEWVRENVISKLEDKNMQRSGLITPTMRMSGYIWKTNEEIKNDLLTFFGCWRDQHFWRAPEGIEIYGYYADYDWVLLCSLFGRMIDLPKGFPMFCFDLKQTLQEKENKWGGKNNPDLIPNSIKDFDNYPRQKNEHNALADAKWNYELYKFLQTI